MPINSEQLKRKPDDMSLVPVVQKRPRAGELVAAGERSSNKGLGDAGPPRTSSLDSPIMLLTGHQSEIYACKFHPNGDIVASAGADKQILLWNTYGECNNYAAIPGHKGAILDLQFSSDGSTIYTTSVDKTIAAWDTKTGVRLKRLKGHANIVNACHATRQGTSMLCSGSDDCCVKLWDTRLKGVVDTYKDQYQILAITFNENADQIIFGGIENLVKVYDLRKKAMLYSMVGHYDTITGITLSPDGNLVSSNSMDNSLCIWDIRPFAPPERCIKTLQGHQHNFEKNLLRCSWSPDGTKVTGGSADRFVYIWDMNYRRILYKLPGHLGSVNDVVFHPNEPIILSGSSDKQLYLGEIEA